MPTHPIDRRSRRGQTLLRPAEPGDVPVIAQLIRGLAEYERLADKVTLDEVELARHLFPSPDPHATFTAARPFAEVILAESADVPGEVIGFALFFHNFSTFRGRPGIYLEDLFVKPEHRGLGHGKALLAELARLASERGCVRLEWTVLDWNEPSIAFYKKLGAAAMDEWTVYRLTGEPLEALAASTRP